MQKLIVAGMIVLTAACGDAKKNAQEEADTREAARVDSLTADIDRSGAELESETELTEKEIDDLLKDM
jgi:hypothetical protein